jgi:hypothetical protein
MDIWCSTVADTKYHTRQTIAKSMYKLEPCQPITHIEVGGQLIAPLIAMAVPNDCCEF